MIKFSNSLSMFGGASSSLSEFTFSSPEANMGVVRVKTAIAVNPFLAAWIAIAFIQVISFLDVFGGGIEAYIPVGMFGIVFVIWGGTAFYKSRSLTGELIIDGKSRKLRVREGLSAFCRGGAELTLPQSGALVCDTYTLRQGKARITHYRLWIYPDEASQGLFDKLSGGATYEGDVLGNTPALPPGAIEVYVSKGDSMLIRRLAESIAKTMQWNIFDFTSRPHVYKRVADLDRPFSKATTLIMSGTDTSVAPKGISLEGFNSVMIRPYPVLVHIGITAAIIAGTAVFMFHPVSLMAADWLSIYSVGLLLLVGAVILSFNSFSELSFDRDGISVRSRLFGLIGIGAAEVISWNKLREVKIKKFPNTLAYQLELISDEDFVSLTISNEAPAKWMFNYLREVTPVR